MAAILSRGWWVDSGTEYPHTKQLYECGIYTSPLAIKINSQPQILRFFSNKSGENNIK